MHRTVVVAAGLLVALGLSAGCASGRSTWTVAAVARNDASVTHVSAAPASATVGHSTAPVAPVTSVATISASQPAATQEGSDHGAAVLEIHTYDLGYQPASLSVPSAGTYTIRLVNDGAIFHDVTFADGTVIGADAGQTAEGPVVIPAQGTLVHVLRTWPRRCRDDWHGHRQGDLGFQLRCREPGAQHRSGRSRRTAADHRYRGGPQRAAAGHERRNGSDAPGRHRT